MSADCRCSGGGLMKGRPVHGCAGPDYERVRSLFARLVVLMPLGMVVFLAVMVVVMLLATVGVDGGDLQDDGFVAGLGEVLLAGGMGEDAAGGQGLQFAGVVGVAEAQLQGAADDVDEEVILFFKNKAENTGIPYQTLINLYLKDCVKNNRQLELSWK